MQSMKKQHSIKEKSPMQFSNKVLLLLAIFTVIFIIIMTIIFCIKDEIPDTLVERYFSCCIGECGILGVIKSVKTIFSKKEDKVDDTLEDTECDILDYEPTDEIN